MYSKNSNFQLKLIVLAITTKAYCTEFKTMQSFTEAIFDFLKNTKNFRNYKT